LIRRFIKKVMPILVWRVMRKIYYLFLKIRYRMIGRPYVPAETTKAHKRRIREGFFDKYCRGKGMDIGYGGDIVVSGCHVWDFEHGDAQYMQGVKEQSFDFVYSSHTLEHMIDPSTALINWWRILKPGGFLIIYMPHKELYEKKNRLPSNWNPDHKYFFLLDRDEEPDTIGMIPLIQRTLSGYEIIYAKVCDENHTITDPNLHSDGEYSIELVLKKEEV